MNEIREKINGLTYIDSSVLEEILEDISNEENSEDKEELFNSFTVKIKELVQNYYDEGNLTSVDRFIESVAGKFNTYGGLKYREIDEYFERNGLVAEEIVSKDEEEVVEAELVEDEEEVVAELVEDEERNNLPEDMIDETDGDNSEDAEEVVEEVEEELEIIKINNRIDELEQELSGESIEDINEQIENLEKEKTEKLEEIDKELEQLKDSKPITEQELIEKINKLKAEQKELWRLGNVDSLSDEDEKRFYEIKDLVNETEQELELLRSDIPTKEQELTEKINKLKAEQKELWRLGSIDSLSPEDEKRFHEVNNLIKKTEQELNIIKKNNPDKLRENLDKRTVLLLKRYHVIKDYDRKILDCRENLKKHEELSELKGIRDSYCKIQSEAIQKFEKEKLSEDELKEQIVEFVNNHSLTPELTKWNEPDKLKAQLMNEVYNNLKVKKIDKKENKKKALLKALSAVAGFGSGLALHSVPGVGTVLAGVWAVKLAKKAINVITNKFPNSRVTGIINGISNKISDKYGMFSEKHPKIAKVVEKVRRVLKSDYTKWFVNGFTAGYAVGNIVDSIRIRQSHCGEYEYTAPEHNAPNVEGKMAPISEASTPTINSGDVLDVSSIDKGLVSSTSENPISLITEAGKEVIADRSVVLPDGRVMWHFKQMSGQGYAWLEESAVKEVLAKVAEGASKIK